MNWLHDPFVFLGRSGGVGWTPWLRHWYQLANFLIWFSYLVIALNLTRLYRRKKTELPAPGLFVLGTVFLVLCGLSHLGNVVVFSGAPYPLITLIDALTAAAAVAAACWLPSVVRWMTRMPSQEYVHTVNKALEDAVARNDRVQRELNRKIAVLTERNRALEQMLRTRDWLAEKAMAMSELTRDLVRDSGDPQFHSDMDTD
jgi:hypothetical protein